MNQKQNKIKFKNDKLPGNDSITDEMIACYCESIFEKLRILFDKIVDFGHYLESLKEDMNF